MFRVQDLKKVKRYVFNSPVVARGIYIYQTRLPKIKALRLRFIFILLVSAIIVASYLRKSGYDENDKLIPKFTRKWQKLTDNNLFLQFPRCDPNISKRKVKKAVLIFYDARRENEFLPQLKWLHESIKEANQYNKRNSVIDLLIYADRTSDGLTKLNCTAENARNMFTNGTCVFYQYSPLIASNNGKPQMNPIFMLAQEKLLFENSDYPYAFSVTMCFDMYNTFKNYDFVLKTDTDTFILPHFSYNMPSNCCFMTGTGGYSGNFDKEWVLKVSKNMGWKSANEYGIGVTWIGTPMQIRITAEMTFRAMIYLARNEVFEIQRLEKGGILNWPEWHFGSYLLYAQHIAINDLIASNYRVNYTSRRLDCYSSSKELMHETNCWHVHCWHTHERFSKSEFAAHRYKDVKFSSLNKSVLSDYLTMVAKQSDDQTV